MNNRKKTTDVLLPPPSVARLEGRRDRAMLGALFYWTLAERQGGTKTDYQYRAQKYAARALDCQAQLEQIGGAE